MTTETEQMKHPLRLFGFCPRCGSNKFKVNDFKSKRCEECGFVLYFNAQAATVAIIQNNKGDILVARRAKEPAKGTLDLPGGFVDSFETGEEGITREVLEETGLRVTDTRYLFSLPNKYVYSGFEEHTLDLFYLCTVHDDSLPTAHDDVAELRWLSPQDINPKDFGLESIRKGINRFIQSLK